MWHEYGVHSIEDLEYFIENINKESVEDEHIITDLDNTVECLNCGASGIIL